MSKLLGQHFLINQEIKAKIIKVLAIKEGDCIIEIGPGHGELTVEFIKQKAKVIAIEKDRRLADFLEARISEQKLENLEIIRGNALEALPAVTQKLKPKKYKLAGNIPYYITGHFFRVIGELDHQPDLIICLIQKEVAERLVAKPPRMNLLAASVQFWAFPKILFEVPPTDFSPAPRVWSALVQLEPKTGVFSQFSEQKEVYYKFIRLIFKQPRKTILNNLAAGLKKSKQEIGEILKTIGLSGGERPQDLTLTELAKGAFLFWE